MVIFESSVELDDDRRLSGSYSIAGRLCRPVHQQQISRSLLEFLKRTRGFDFTGYKRATLERRITKRLQSVGCNDFTEYLDYLEVHPEEFGQLFNTVLINVTSFFRDGRRGSSSRVRLSRA